MQHLFLATISILTFLINPASTQLKLSKPNSVNFQKPLLSQNSSKPVQLRLQAEKQIVTKDENGKENITWQSLPANAVVQPGDLIRYTIRGENSTSSPVNNFVLNQPIPKQTVYVLNSATGTDTKITYSIDNGKNYGTNPTIQETLPDGTITTKPAPADAYTHIRWEFTKPVNPAEIEATYQIKVK